MELYCADSNCDCQRVLINVISRSRPGEILATINYGWESAAFYAKWIGNAHDAAAFQGTWLDPLNPQTIYAPILLELFEDVLQDDAYVQRLRAHYAQLKQVIKEKQRAKRISAGKKKRRAK